MQRGVNCLRGVVRFGGWFPRPVFRLSPPLLRIQRRFCATVPKTSTPKTDTTPKSDEFLKLREAAERGDPKAQNSLGECYQQAKGVSEDLFLSVFLFQKSANQGYAPGQHNLALCYFEGRGAAEDLPLAAKWFRSAADQGFAPAQWRLAGFYREGFGGLEKDHVKSISWLRKAAEQGHALAQHDLGGFLLLAGGAENETESLIWFKKSANQGCREAQTRLGAILIGGQGMIGANAEEGYKWFRKAASKGDPEALTHLGICYTQGWGVEADPKTAFKCWMKAAKLGDSKAMSCLGLAYENGVGVEIDREKGQMWSRKSMIAQGVEPPTASDLDGMYQQSKQFASSYDQQREQEFIRTLEAKMANATDEKAAFEEMTKLAKEFNVPLPDNVNLETMEGLVPKETTAPSEQRDKPAAEASKATRSNAGS